MERFELDLFGSDKENPFPTTHMSIEEKYADCDVKTLGLVGLAYLGRDIYRVGVMPNLNGHTFNWYKNTLLTYQTRAIVQYVDFLLINHRMTFRLITLRGFLIGGIETAAASQLGKDLTSNLAVVGQLEGYVQLTAGNVVVT